MSIEIQPYFAEGERYPALVGVRAEGDEYETAYVSKSELVDALAENAKLQDELEFANDQCERAVLELLDQQGQLKDENAKLRKQLEHVQPTDCEGNVLDIADTVHMLRSEYDGDHEWEDVVTELVLTKWGGDRWIVRGSKGEAWACDCTKTGYDEDAYEASDDVEPFGEPTLLEVENAKLREQIDGAHMSRLLTENENAKLRELVCWMYDRMDESCAVQYPYAPAPISYDRLMQALARARDLGVEVDA